METENSVSRRNLYSKGLMLVLFHSPSKDICEIAQSKDNKDAIFILKGVLKNGVQKDLIRIDFKDGVAIPIYEE